MRVAADAVVVADGDVDGAGGLLVQQDRPDQVLDGEVGPDTQFREVVGGVADLGGGVLDFRADVVIGDVRDGAVLDPEFESVSLDRKSVV